MSIPTRYKPQSSEKKYQQFWENEGIYNFSPNSGCPIYSIDTPPPTVSGELHLGHCYSYSHADFIARFWRMNGYIVYYPMGWDDNGLPTERLVEKRLGIKPENVGRENFIKAIVETSKDLEERYEKLWRRLALSVDWKYNYATISSYARKVSQYSFIDLYRKNLTYRSSSPTIWCPQCGTAIAQAEVDDLERETQFHTLVFHTKDGEILPIATTRPELLAACVAIFINPEDKRYKELVGKPAITPIYGREVPIKIDPKADREKGTGIVMCCTFGDTTDVEWWRKHDLPLINIMGQDGRLNETAGAYAGLDVKTAREKIIDDLTNQGLLLETKNSMQTIRVHERCETPVEYIETKQWFIKILENRERFIEAGRSIDWHPSFMRSRYEAWVQNLAWDWCISRQRFYGVPFPVWYCKKCGETILADLSDLPVDPLVSSPSNPCSCGSDKFTPEVDVMDTWATSSVSPQIAGKWLEREELFELVFPMSLRPHSHEIIRTWTFYTIVKSLYHFNKIPWSNIAVSGWGILPEGGKISKSKGGGPIDPFRTMDQYSADAVRYWAASTALGRDAAVSEEKISAGQKLVTKLWNVTVFSMRFLEGYRPHQEDTLILTPTDCWVLSTLQNVIQNTTKYFENYEYASAKEEVETFFWNIFTDNYLEMVKTRLYDLPDNDPQKESAKYTLWKVLFTLIKLLAPFMPYITEDIYQQCFAEKEDAKSIHISSWPRVSEITTNKSSEDIGKALIGIATVVRRFKSVSRLRMGEPINFLYISTPNHALLGLLQDSQLDIKSVTRAQEIHFSKDPNIKSQLIDGYKDFWIELIHENSSATG